MLYMLKLQLHEEIKGNGTNNSGGENEKEKIYRTLQHNDSFWKYQTTPKIAQKYTSNK